MNTDSCTLITGITGSVGVEALRWMLRCQPGAQARLLIRASDEQHLQQRWAKVLADASGGALRPEDVPGLRPVAGELTAPELGLSPRDAQTLQAEMTHLLHIAADIRFVAPLAESRAANVEGTRRLLDLAEGARNLRAIGHTSTIFVAGKRAGRIREADLAHDAGFVNVYETTKNEAERLVRERMGSLPISVYRLTLLPGRQQDGYVRDYNAFHELLRAFSLGLLPIVPGEPGACIDLLPTDYSADCLMELFHGAFRPGQTHQICAGDQAISLEDFLPYAESLFCERLPRWRRGQHQRPDIADRETYSLFKQTVRRAQNPLFTQVIAVLGSCAEHMLLPKRWERASVDAALGGRLPVPDLRSYFPRILDRCLEDRWGRPAPAAAA